MLVTGGTGYLGGELLRAAPGVAATHLTTEPASLAGVDWLRLDVRDRAAVDAAFERLRPTAVVHTAYLQDGPEAQDTNVLGSEVVAVAAASAGARLIHLSTDLVFDVVQHIGLDAGLVDNKVCAIDETWSGLRFVYRVADRAKIRLIPLLRALTSVVDGTSDVDRSPTVTMPISACP